ncbi:MAG: 50S ribosomal protein L17 [Bacteroidales bacterium]|jgi:large subunit ribosomal protein L17|nr:50S ribosomal protein L17 [Bacteroidales bacterium]
MRHGKKFNHLGRTSSHRKAMLSNMATSLIIHKRIKTTLAKAKALRVYFEPLVTKSKSDTTHQRRMVFSVLQSKEAVSELFGVISEKAANRPGGYTRIIKLGIRLGDNAEMCMIELVDFNEHMLSQKADSKQAEKTTRRSRRGGKKAETAVAAPVAEVAEEAQVVEETSAEVEETVVDSVEETKVEDVADEKSSDEETEEKK